MINTNFYTSIGKRRFISMIMVQEKELISRVCGGSADDEWSFMKQYWAVSGLRVRAVRRGHRKKRDGKIKCAQNRVRF